MIERIQEIIDNSGLDTKLYIKDLRNNKDIVAIGIDKPVKVNSIMYVPILLATCSLIYDRKASIKDEIKIVNPQNLKTYVTEVGENSYRLDELLKIMIIMNDMVAAVNILRHIGMDKVNDFLRNEGFKFTDLSSSSTATVKDLGVMFEKTFKRRFISPRMCDFATDILHRSRGSEMLSRLILDDVKIAKHEDCTITNATACGVVLCQDTEYLISIAVDKQGNTDPEVLKRHIGHISKITYDYLNMPETM